MLVSLKIENIAIIESAAIEFGYGLNVLTGETGAGKSIVIDSINAILGERTSRDLIRTGAECARVFAVFEDVGENAAALLSENGIDCSDGVLIVSRVIYREGRNICRVNDFPVTVALLRELGRELIDIHGQHDNQALLTPERHCSFIDCFGGCAPLIEKYRKSYRELCSVRSELKSINTDEREKQQRTDLLLYQINELESAEISPGERDSLTERKNIINNSQRIISCLNEAYGYLKCDDGVLDGISGACDEIDRACAYLPGLSETSEKINDIRYELEDIAETVRDSLQEVDCDERELDEIEERLDLLYRISRKYGDTEEEMLEYLAKAKSELENIEFSEERLLRLREEEEILLTQTEKLAGKLTLERMQAGEKLSGLVCSELRDLDMPGVVFAVKRTEIPLGSDGSDFIEFLVSANAGEEPKPLAKIASGGELSRIMLAIKNVLADTDSIDTLIFDEIDTGVSGRAAQKIALKLRSVSGGRQVICVTHLAQIASQGDVHLLISKSVREGKTYTQIRSVTGEERIEEIARIMGGTEITQSQWQTAREMLENAGNI